jgi:hypothetical protein
MIERLMNLPCPLVFLKKVDSGKIFLAPPLKIKTLAHNNRQAFFIGTKYCASYTDTLDYKVDIDFFLFVFLPLSKNKLRTGGPHRHTGMIYYPFYMHGSCRTT